MAIELGKINTQDLVENNYKIIGIGTNKTPNSNGIFHVNFTTLSQAKDNLYNLIMTKKGERVMHPDFGCDIWNLAFSQIVDSETDIAVENAIVTAVERWLPYLTITSIVIDDNPDIRDRNILKLEIGFALTNNQNLRENLEVNIKE